MGTAYFWRSILKLFIYGFNFNREILQYKDRRIIMNIILKNGTGEIEEKKSRFIAHIFSVENEDEAEQYINAVRKKYWDA